MIDMVGAGTYWRRAGGTLLAACTLATAGCGDDSAPGGTLPPGGTSTAPAPSPSPTTAPASAPTISDDDAAALLEGFTGELVMTRQRDLLDRGLINVMTHNESGHDVIATDLQLVADHFETTAADPRTSKLADGRRVALQVPYGTVIECTSARKVAAQLQMTFTVEGSGGEHTASVEIGGAGILDGIRAAQCAARSFDAATEISIDAVTADDDAVEATVVIERSSGTSSFRLEHVAGTILVGVEAVGDSLPVVVDGNGPVALPLQFFVNRCDPHALAEVTKRYGLDVEVSIDGGPPQPVAVGIDELVPDLERIVEHCHDESD